MFETLTLMLGILCTDVFSNLNVESQMVESKFTHSTSRKYIGTISKAYHRDLNRNLSKCGRVAKLASIVSQCVMISAVW